MKRIRNRENIYIKYKLQKNVKGHDIPHSGVTTIPPPILLVSDNIITLQMNVKRFKLPG